MATAKQRAPPVAIGARLLQLCAAEAIARKQSGSRQLCSRLGSDLYLPTADCSGSEDEDKLPFFKVLIIIIEKRSMDYRLYTFSSVGEWGWNVRHVDVEYQDRIGAMLRQHEAVVCGGAAHWFFGGGSGFYTLDVNARTDDFSITRLHTVKPGDLVRPDTYDVPYLSVDAEGRLLLLCLQLDGSQLEIRRWHEDGMRPLITRLEPRTQQKKTKRMFGLRQSWPQQTGTSQIIDGRSRRPRLTKKWEKNRTREGEEGWAHTKFGVDPNSYQGTVNPNCLAGRSMALIQTAPQIKQRYTCLGEKNGTLLIKGDDQHMYVADVKTGVMQEVTDYRCGHDVSHREIVP